MIGLGALVLAIVVGRVVGAVEFPDAWDLRLFDPIDQIVVWARDNLSWLTRPINDFIVGSVIVPVRDFLIQDVAWPVLVFITGWALWMVKGWRLAVFGMVVPAALRSTRVRYFTVTVSFLLSVPPAELDAPEPTRIVIAFVAALYSPRSSPALSVFAPVPVPAEIASDPGT